MISRAQKHLILTLLGVFLQGLALAQTQDSYEYNSEITWGVNKNSSGGFIGGFVLKKARKLNDRMLETFGIELMNVKNSQEVKKNSLSTGNYFIYGKSNYLYSIRLQYGRDLIVFTKAPQQGVEIKIVTAIGPSIGIIAPYYIERAVDNSFFSTVKEQYDPNNPLHNFGNILGTGNLFQGLGQSSVQMGANIKLGVNFETGSLKSSVQGFEVGFLLDAYLKKVILMPTTENYSLYPTVYITLFFGTRK